MSSASGQLQSERVIVQAPLSFAGGTKRILRLTEPQRALALKSIVPPWWKGALFALLDGLIVLAVGLFMFLTWAFIIVWYSFFGLLLVPYRLIRRSDRDRQRDALQHREMLDAALAAQAMADRRLAEQGTADRGPARANAAEQENRARQENRTRQEDRRHR